MLVLVADWAGEAAKLGRMIILGLIRQGDLQASIKPE
jgi:hypothetical protein